MWSADKKVGVVIADGAFRLSYHEDKVGTIRYTINDACWLALESFPFNPFDEEFEEENYEEKNVFLQRAFAIFIHSCTYYFHFCFKFH